MQHNLKIIQWLKNNKNVEPVVQCLEERLLWLEVREPTSDGIVYEVWETKYDELDEIVSELYNLMDKKERNLEKVINMIENYQAIHGGLSRLKMEEVVSL